MTPFKTGFSPTLAAGFLSIAVLLSGCSNEVSSIQKDSPANAFKDYRAENANNAAVIGIGEPISKQQMRANATIKLNGLFDLENVMNNVAGTYNIAVRWGAGARKNIRKNILMSELTFDEARSYIEDVYNVQIIREGERRLLVLPSVSEARIAEFNPGVGVKLSEAIRGLAAQCGTNLVLSETDQKLVNSYVSTRLTDITCHDAYEALLAPQGLSLIDKGGYAIISGLPQRQWTLNLFEPEREEETEVSYQSEFESSSDDESASSSGSQTAGGRNTVTVTKTRNLWSELAGDLNALLASSCTQLAQDVDGIDFGGDLLAPPSATGEDEIIVDSDPLGGASSDENDVSRCGYVRVNKSVGLVQMQATYTVLEQADDLIRRVEDVASRRLLLEARVLAVTRTREFRQNANLSANASNGSDNVLSTGFGGSIGSIASNLTGRLASVNQPGGFLSGRAAGLDAVVGLVEEFGTTYQLMQPIMELMDRQRGTLIDGTNRIFFTRETEIETTDAGTIRNTQANTFSQFAGLQFSATAQVAEGNEPHTISLQIPITDISDEESIPQVVDGVTLNDNVPVVTTRLIDQKVRIRDGEVKVIGGLTKTVAIDRESGLPIARDIPAFGALFNEENISFEKVEFVVLLQVRRLY